MAEQIPVSPLVHKKSKRMDKKRVLTSGDAGKVIPISFTPLLRMDQVTRGEYVVNVEMMETAERLASGISVCFYAHFWPFLAAERFDGMDNFNRSYQKVAETSGSVTPFFETVNYSASDEFWLTLGVHAAAGGAINASPLEAYNGIVNHRRKARSKSLPLRTKHDATLAEAFWRNNSMSHIVADFDQAKLDGEVPITGLNFGGLTTDHKTDSFNGFYLPGGDDPGATNSNGKYIWDDISMEMSSSGATLSLANIEMVKKTAAFARIRSNYDGIDDDHVIDLLMDGTSVPDEMSKQPILLAKSESQFGYSQRYATDAANLDESLTNGIAQGRMKIRCPQTNTGGIVMITAEIVPEQLYERKKDYFLYATDTDHLPSTLRDELDPEKVSVVKNSHVDVLHSNPDNTFGYSYLNHEWDRNLVNVGGKYIRPVNDAFDEDRQKIWTTEVSDPALNADFLLSGTLHKKVFADSVADSFEITALGGMEISGYTVRGQALQEATADYSTIIADVETARISK
jgi:hypothetical protein